MTNINQEYLAQCYSANLPGIKKHLENGADINFKDGVCLIRIIAGTGLLKEKKATLDYLLAQNIKFQTDEDTPLTWAVIHKELELVLYFLNKGYDPNADEGVAIATAIKNQSSKILYHLLKGGGKISQEVTDMLQGEEVEIPKCISKILLLQDYNRVRYQNEQYENEQQIAIDYVFNISKSTELECHIPKEDIIE